VDGSRGLGSIAARLSDRASYQLSLISTRLPNGTHIPRGQCAAQILSGFDDRQLVVVTGGPGAGKSAVISDLAPLLQESGPLFFFRAAELGQPVEQRYADCCH
jgi:ABC-type lipoprotein export system ATPase subunit